MFTGEKFYEFERISRIILPLLYFTQKLAANDDFDLIVRQVENLVAHILKIPISILQVKYSLYFVIGFFLGGIG